MAFTAPSFSLVHVGGRGRRCRKWLLCLGICKEETEIALKPTGIQNIKASNARNEQSLKEKGRSLLSFRPHFVHLQNNRPLRSMYVIIALIGTSCVEMHAVFLVSFYFSVQMCHFNIMSLLSLDTRPNC